MTKTELAAAYGVCLNTLKKWLKPHAEALGQYTGKRVLTPNQVQIIYDRIGEP